MTSEDVPERAGGSTTLLFTIKNEKLDTSLAEESMPTD